MGILLEEVVLDFPSMIEPELIGQHDLVEGFLEESEFVVLAPGLGQLMFVEDAEFHSKRRARSTGFGKPRIRVRSLRRPIVETTTMSQP
jgi:hypothetical protein